MSKTPTIKWGQKQQTLILTVTIPEAVKESVKISDTNQLSIEFNSGDQKYELKDMELFDKVKTPTLDVKNTGRQINIHVKKDKAESWPRLFKEKAKYHWLHVDWDQWESSEEEEPEQPQMGQPGQFDQAQLMQMLQQQPGGQEALQNMMMQQQMQQGGILPQAPSGGDAGDGLDDLDDDDGEDDLPPLDVTEE